MNGPYDNVLENIFRQQTNGCQTEPIVDFGGTVWSFNGKIICFVVIRCIDTVHGVQFIHFVATLTV